MATDTCQSLVLSSDIFFVRPLTSDLLALYLHFSIFFCFFPIVLHCSVFVFFKFLLFFSNCFALLCIFNLYFSIFFCFFPIVLHNPNATQSLKDNGGPIWAKQKNLLEVHKSLLSRNQFCTGRNIWLAPTKPVDITVHVQARCF